MLKLALETTSGPIGIIAINYENMVRMKAGMPLDIDLKEITPPGKRMNRLIIHYSATYEDAMRDMKKDGLPVSDTMLEAARGLDQQLKRERQERGRAS